MLYKRICVQFSTLLNHSTSIPVTSSKVSPVSRYWCIINIQSQFLPHLAFFTKKSVVMKQNNQNIRNVQRPTIHFKKMDFLEAQQEITFQIFLLLMRDQFVIYVFSNLLERENSQERTTQNIFIRNVCNIFNHKNITHWIFWNHGEKTPQQK